MAAATLADEPVLAEPSSPINRRRVPAAPGEGVEPGAARGPSSTRMPSATSRLRSRGRARAPRLSVSCVCLKVTPGHPGGALAARPCSLVPVATSGVEERLVWEAREDSDTLVQLLLQK